MEQVIEEVIETVETNSMDGTQIGEQIDAKEENANQAQQEPDEKETEDATTEPKAFNPNDVKFELDEPVVEEEPELSTQEKLDKYLTQDEKRAYGDTTKYITEMLDGHFEEDKELVSTLMGNPDLVRVLTVIANKSKQAPTVQGKAVIKTSDKASGVVDSNIAFGKLEQYLVDNMSNPDMDVKGYVNSIIENATNKEELQNTFKDYL